MYLANANDIVGKKSIVFLTFDALRYDISVKCFQDGLTPNIEKLIPSGWEERHSPSTFTFGSHQSFFAGFLPTPSRPGKHERLFAAAFDGSETTTSNTFVFESADIITGFKKLGYRTLCIGGVGFFNKRTQLGNVLPAMFEESHWCPEFGVTNVDSTEMQFRYVEQWLQELSDGEKYFIFINISAIHQPNYFYLPESTTDSLETHAMALQYVDQQLPILTNALQMHDDTFCILCSDHGTAYGEGGYTGHRLAHPVVLTVPYAHAILKKTK